jgi:hypothetical protein
LPFFPGVRIANQGDAYERWLSFVETIAPKTRLGEDPQTKAVGLLFRGGVWLGSLMLADDVRSFHVIEDIRRVEGDLVARGARVVNKGFAHELEVLGGLTVNSALLRHKPPPIRFRGPLTLAGVKFVEDLSAPPERLLRWMAGSGRLLRAGRELFELAEERGEGGVVHLLRGRDGAGTYVWEQSEWQPLARSSLNPQLLDEINHKLERFCLLIGVGAGYAINHPRKVGFNLRKIAGYLRLLERECRRLVEAGVAACAAGDADPRQGGNEIAEVLRILQDLERNVYGPNPDEPNIRIMLDLLGERALAAVAAANSLPRTACDERQVKADLAFLRRLEDDVTSDDLLPSGTRTLLLLSRLLVSRPGQRAVLAALAQLKTNFDLIAASTGLGARVRFMHLLTRPGAVFTVFRKKAVSGAAGAALKALESGFRTLESTPPTRVLRDIAVSPELARAADGAEDGAAPDSAADKRLLSALYSFKGPVDEVPDAPRVMPEVYRVALFSPAARSIDEAQRVLAGKGEGLGVGAQVVAHALRTRKPSEFIRFLVRRLEWDHSVLQAFNAVTLRLRRMESVEQEREEAAVSAAPTAPRKELPPELKAYVHMKLNRVCLRLGLGKGFLEQHADSYRQNMEKLLYFMVVSHENAQMGGGEEQTGRVRQVITDFAKRLEALEEHILAAHSDQVHQILSDLDDKYLRLVDGVLSRARRKVRSRDLKADIAVLRVLAGEDLTVERLFGTPERLLFYLNGVLESEDMKKAVYALVRPVHRAFLGLQDRGVVHRDVAVHDVLRNYDGFVRNLSGAGEGTGNGGASGPVQVPEELRPLAEAMAELRARSLTEVLKVLASTQLSSPTEAALRDKDLVADLALFDIGPLSELRLNPTQFARLLLMQLASFARNDLKAMHGAGGSEGMPPAELISRLLAKLRWYDEIIDAYNGLAAHHGGS